MTERDDSMLDAELERRTKQAFDRSVAEVDAATRSRLTQARHRALDELAKPRAWLGTRAWLGPAGALAAAALVAVLVMRPDDPATDPRVQQAAVLGDLEILLDDEGEIEMYDEEIEFYAWLEQQPEIAEPAESGDGVG